MPPEGFLEIPVSSASARGRPTLLFSPGDGQPGGLPPSVRRYLDEGEAAGVPDGAVCRSRRPWHRLERRTAPPILFAYLGRRDCRFVRNIAGALALNGFHCVYPRSAGPGFAEALWHVLADERTTANLGLVGKTYGNGAIKVDPGSDTSYFEGQIEFNKLAIEVYKQELAEFQASIGDK